MVGSIAYLPGRRALWRCHVSDKSIFFNGVGSSNYIVHVRYFMAIWCVSLNKFHIIDVGIWRVSYQLSYAYNDDHVRVVACIWMEPHMSVVLMIGWGLQGGRGLLYYVFI